MNLDYFAGLAVLESPDLSTGDMPAFLPGSRTPASGAAPEPQPMTNEQRIPARVEEMIRLAVITRGYSGLGMQMVHRGTTSLKKL